MTQHNKAEDEVGILEILLLMFIAFKLTGVIAWSWWFVMAPLWVPLGLIFVAFVVTKIRKDR